MASWANDSETLAGIEEARERDAYDPWWGDRAVAGMELERLARQEDRREAERFQAKIDAALSADPLAPEDAS